MFTSAYVCVHAHVYLHARMQVLTCMHVWVHVGV